MAAPERAALGELMESCPELCCWKKYLASTVTLRCANISLRIAGRIETSIAYLTPSNS